jgi:hypothetical protein
MENKNTFYFSKNIETHYDKDELVPQTGDELNICKDEDVALASYMRYRDDERDAPYEPIEGEFLTDLFKKELIDGTMCNPIYVGGKKFGFFGCRVKLTTWLYEGHFFLYEME